jgi:ABC-2 type transport system permease protein
MKKFLSIVKREFKLFAGNKIMVSLYIGGPVLYALLFGAVYSKGKVTDLPIMVIDKDHTALSMGLIDRLEDAEVLTIKEVRYEEVDLKKIFMKDEFYAVVVIPYRFQADILQSRQPEIATYINNTNLLTSGYVTRSIAVTTGTLNAILTTHSGKIADAFTTNTFRLFNPSSNYSIYIWPSYLGIILQSVILMVLALSFASEYERNTLTALYVLSGRSPLLIIVSKLFPYTIIAFFILLVYGLYFHFFKQHLPDNIGQAIFITLLYAITNSFIGMIAGLLFKTQLQSIQFLQLLIMPIYISSGFSWPFDQEGWVAKLYGYLFPFMPFVNGLRILLIEHGRLHHILDYVTIQVIQLGLYFIIAYILFRFKLKRLFLTT